MIEIDIREFRGDRDRLSEFLGDKYKGPMQVQRNMIRLGDSGRPEADPSLQDVKDLVKRALHHMRMDDYRVVTQAGLVTIRERRSHEPHGKRKGSVPSVRQTVPYFFPG